MPRKAKVEPKRKKRKYTRRAVQAAPAPGTLVRVDNPGFAEAAGHPGALAISGGRCEGGCCMELTLRTADGKPLTVEDVLEFARDALPQILTLHGLPNPRKPDVPRHAFN